MEKCNFCIKRITGRTSRKKTRKNISRKKQVSEVELLEMLIKKIVAKLEKN